MHEIALADELAAIRAEIERLKKREAALRAAILARKGRVPPGRWHRVEVIERKARVLDRALLPDDIATDPAYFRDRVAQYVRCLPVQLAGSRPGGSPSAHNSKPVKLPEHPIS